MVKRTYNQFCPAARALDLVGERWTLLIVRDLLRGPRRYTDLRNGLPGMASNLLAQRLGQLEEAGLVRREHRDEPTPRDVYVLTDRGLELRSVLMAIGRFGLDYLDAPAPGDVVSADSFPEGLATMALAEELPDDELSIRFALEEGDFILTIAAAGPEGGRRPAAERISVEQDAVTSVDVTIRGSLPALLAVRRGELDGAEAIARGVLEVEGDDSAGDAARRVFGFSRRARRG